MMARAHKQSGMTLVELVVAIVVIAIAVSAVLGVLADNNRHSADAMIVSQGVSIAEAYLEEISLRSFADPDGSDGEAARASFDDVDDYDGLVDAGAADQFGNPIGSLSAYTVTVAVSPSGALSGVPPADLLRIDVNVRFDPYIDFTLSGYKARL